MQPHTKIVNITHWRHPSAVEPFLTVATLNRGSLEEEHCYWRVVLSETTEREKLHSYGMVKNYTEAETHAREVFKKLTGHEAVLFKRDITWKGVMSDGTPYVCVTLYNREEATTHWDVTLGTNEEQFISWERAPDSVPQNRLLMAKGTTPLEEDAFIINSKALEILLPSYHLINRL